MTAKETEILQNIQRKIIHNPFRILGITCEASIRNITRQGSRLKKYLLAEQSISDFSFSTLDNLQRTPADAEQALQALSTDESRLSNALFWFWNHNNITDEAAFELLKDNHPYEALNIWNKLIYATGEKDFKEVTAKNLSAFHNWSILSLIITYVSPNSPHSSPQAIAQAIKTHLQMLDSPHWKQFKESVTDKTYHIEQEQLELTFLNSMVSFEEILTMPDIFSQPFQARTAWVDKYFYTLQEIIASITKNLDEAKKDALDKIPAAAKEAGLCAKKELQSAKPILSPEQYNQLSDKITQKLLQGAIVYFNYYSEDSNRKNAPKNFDTHALEILDLAKNFCRSKFLEQRIEVNYKTIAEYRYKEGMFILCALQEAWKICQNIESQNSVLLNLLGQRYEVNSEKLGQMLNKFITTQALQQLAASRQEETIAEVIKMLNKLNKYTGTYEWSQQLNKFNWQERCLKSYENLPKNSLVRLLALLTFIQKNIDWTEPFIPLLETEMTPEMYQTIVKANATEQLEVWNALLRSLAFDSYTLQTIENKLIQILPPDSPLFQILQKRAKKRSLIREVIVTVVIVILGFIAYGIYASIKTSQKDKIAFNEAIQKNTIEAYEEFIATQPSQTYIDAAKIKIRAIKDQKAWKSLKEEKRYQEYLNQYPNGLFQKEATDAIEQQKWGTEQAAWETALNDNLISSYQKYIRLYPNGKHIQAAREKELDFKILDYYNRARGDLPRPDYIRYKSGTTSVFRIKNNTSANLTIYFSGPSIRELDIPNGETSAVSLSNGTYRVVALTKRGEPFANTMTFKNGYYEASYYIQSYYGSRPRRRY